MSNLNKKNYDFSKISNTNTGLNDFYSEVYGSSSIPKLKSNKISNNPLSDPEVIQERAEMTEVQNKFVKKLTELVLERLPEEDFKQRLIKINNDVINDVPKIEQERIFTIISVLYYSFIEIQHLESKGQIVRQNRINSVSNHLPRLKSFSEDGDGGSTGECKQETSYAEVLVGAIRTWGSGITEKATSVVKGAGAALGTWLVIWCKMNDITDDFEYCGEILERCQTPGNHPTWVNSGPAGANNKCIDCFLNCTRIGAWTCGTNFKIPYH